VPENVTPEEAQALAADAPASGEVVELRDFRQPRRLSAARQGAIRQSITRELPQVERELSTWLRTDVTASLGGIGESSALGLFDGQEDPITILTIEVNGVQGWIVWDNITAQRMVLSALGTELPEEFEPRTLSPLEVGLVADIAQVLLDKLEAVLGLEIRTGTLSQSLREFVAQHDTDPGGDPQRLFLHMDVEGLGDEPAVLRLYVPGVLPRHPSARNESTPPLPNHLDDVPLELSAVLGTTEVLLSDLMKVEVGDVIPLPTPVGQPVELYIEGDRTGTASWGNHRGRLALSIERLDGVNKEAPSHE